MPGNKLAVVFLPINVLSLRPRRHRCIRPEVAVRDEAFTGYDLAMTALVVRPADHSDLPHLSDLYVHLNPDDARCSPEDAVVVLDRLLCYKGSGVLVGTIRDALVTTCTLVVIPNLTRGGRPYALIENVVTHADHRGVGYGRTILNAAVERAWEAGCYKVMLITGSKKPSTLAFYEAAGFDQSKTSFQVRRAVIRPE